MTDRPTDAVDAEPPPTPPARAIAEHTLALDAARGRLDRVVAGVFDHLLPSRAAAKRACRRGDVLVDGRPAEPSRWVGPGQHLALRPDSSLRAPVFELPLEVLWEDDTLAVVYKPAGFPVSGNRHRTIAHALPHNLAPSERPDALPQPWPAHRLDAQTTGLLVVGKTAGALVGLGRAFAARRVQKTYRALVVGRLDGEGTIARPLDGRPAVTHYAAREHVPSPWCAWITALDAAPETGRTHQIRRHLAALGHPVLGDRLYTREGPLLRGSGLYLSAVGIELEHPCGPPGARISVAVPPPPRFAALWRRTRKAWAVKEAHAG